MPDSPHKKNNLGQSPTDANKSTTTGDEGSKKEHIETSIVSQRELSRELGFKEAISIGLGGTIGGGLFSVLGIVAGIAGPAALVSFGLGGVIGLLIGYSYAKLALRYPSAGGSYTFCKAAFGRRIGAFFGWLLWVAYLASCSLYAYTFGVYFADMVVPNAAAPWVFKLIHLLFSVILIILSTIINLVGVKETGKSQNIIVLVKVIILLIFIGITIPAAIKNVGENFTPFFPDEEGNANNIFLGLSLAVVGTTILFVAFEGVELIPNATEEIIDPEKNIPRSIFATIIISTVIYLLVVFTALAGTNYTAFEGTNAETALAQVAENAIGIAGSIIIAIGALFSTASAFNASLYGSSRLGYVMAREKIFPGVFKKVSDKNHVPYVSILIISTITALMTLTLNLKQIAELASTIFLLLFASVSLSSLLLRKKTKANFIIPFLGFLFSSLCFFLFLWYLINGIRLEVLAGTPLTETEGFVSILVLPIVLLVVGIGSYLTTHYYDKKKAKKQ
ncbi:MAG: APC family permease [Asgard group archaeon]|nr:APC family permease [Asgard group archaeon]